MPVKKLVSSKLDWLELALQLDPVLRILRKLSAAFVRLMMLVIASRILSTIDHLLVFKVLHSENSLRAPYLHFESRIHVVNPPKTIDSDCDDENDTEQRKVKENSGHTKEGNIGQASSVRNWLDSLDDQ